MTMHVSPHSFYSRRRFLGTAATLVAGSSALTGRDAPHRRTFKEMIFNDDPPLDAACKPEPARWSDSTLTAAWIGHSTILLNFFGMRIITDPVFSDRIGLNVAGLFTVGPRRLVNPALLPEELPAVDLILLSHAHMDHLDIPSLKHFDRSVPVIMAKNTYDVIDDLDFQRVYELDWGKWTSIQGMRVEALEVKHFGWRYPWEEDRSRGNPDGRSYNGYLLSYAGHHIVFGGDTAYHENFRTLCERNLPIDLAMMPIGAYDPWIRNHASPEQSLMMADQMGARSILPMHWNTFIQSQEPTDEPLQRLRRAAEPDIQEIALQSIGETWSLDAKDHQPRSGEPNLNPPAMY
jgi:L-ascorbate metabolism protein UlaG (beta-lactamase superfamily)